jgi:hypothetical protein
MLWLDLPLMLLVQGGDASSQGVPFTGNNRGQTLSIALGAIATARWPVFVDLTDGGQHHLLQLKGDKLLVWRNLTPTQAYWKMSSVLLADSRLTQYELDLDTAPEDEESVRTFKKLRTTIQVQCVLREQLDSVLPFLSDPYERYQTAFDIIASHVSAAGDGGDAVEPAEGPYAFMYV